MRALRARDDLYAAVEFAIVKKTRECARLLTRMRSDRSADRRVHETRTRLKQMRALLRLVRPAMQDERYRRAARILKSTSRSLTAVRDAKVVLDGYERLQAGCEAAEPDKRHRRLQARLAAARSRLSPDERQRFAGDFATVEKLVASSPRARAGWKAVARALRHDYSGARHALELARSEPSDRHLHELRKRSKSLLYLCDFLRRHSAHAAGQVTQLKRLGKFLGDDRDLSLLSRAARSRGLTRRIARDQADLRSRSRRLATQIYRDSPTAFVKQIHREWRQSR